jgi:hypothetical protein
MFVISDSEILVFHHSFRSFLSKFLLSAIRTNPISIQPVMVAITFIM